jgi:hypothetical protein
MRNVTLVLTLSACVGPAGDGLDDTDGERPDSLQCDDTPTELAFDADSPLGFSAADVAEALVGSRTVDAWMGEGPATISATVGLTDLGAPTFHDLEPAEDADDLEDTDPELGAPDAGPCVDHLELPANAAFASGDGAFDETFAVRLRATTPSDAAAHHDLDPDALRGTYVVTGLDPDAWDEVSLSFVNTWGDDTVRGELLVSASRDLGDGVSEGFVGPVMRWPAE